MEKEMFFRIIAAILLTTFIDIYLYFGLRLLTKHSKKNIRRIVFWSHWSIPIAFLIFSFFYGRYISNLQPEHIQFREAFTISGIYFSIYIPKFILCIFLFLQHFIRLFDIIAHKAAKFTCSAHDYFYKKTILFKIGIFTSILVFIALIYGIKWGKYDYTIETVTIKSNKLPKSFNNLKVIHISDAHLGSFPDTSKFSEAIAIINSKKADIIVFTGDLVNTESAEAMDYIPLFKRLNANYGKYAVLGNHDMGDYKNWDSEQAKQNNLNLIDSFYKYSDFRLLNNENEIVQSAEDSIAILGVKNWGKPPFKQYGNLKQAQKGIKDSLFQILLSHDPSHWDAEVIPFTSIDLTLSGHTHGMQMGVNNRFIKWSPVSFLYPRWNGLYRLGEQYLYVNRGVGFIGFPGRIGMWPEITLLVLKKE